jgi:hypothetical protein
MRKTCTMVIVAALLGVPSLATAADKCPAELSQAKTMLGKATTAAKTAATAPRELAGARTQDVQAPRTGSQDIEAPRTGSQDIQAPRAGAQDIQAPRAQAPTGKNAADDKARLDKARKLVSDSEAACKKGDMALSTSKANEAMALLK